MPIYEFNCQDCDDYFEVFVQSTRTDDPVRCPACGSFKVGKQVSVFASQGSGTQSASDFGSAAACSTGST